MKKYNSGAGPCILPREVIEKTANVVLDFNGIGPLIAEISHRSKDSQSVMDEAMALVKEVLNVPEGYPVLFLGDGASLEFCMTPFNFSIKRADYLSTGIWAKKVMKEAKLFGDVVEAASSTDENYTYPPKNFDVPTDLDYLHITTNNTIYGTEYHEDLDIPVRLIGDMSSDIFNRPVDVSKYDYIYGGAQKNLSMAGVTFIVIKDEVLGRVQREIPTMSDYRTHIRKGSMFNTPPVVPIYTALEDLRWIKANGGVEAMEKLAKECADIVYGETDRNELFRGTAECEGDRSYMNICFVLNDEYAELQDEFFKLAIERGMAGIKGHRDVGGFHVSCCNTMTVEGCKALIETVKEFETKHQIYKD